MPDWRKAGITSSPESSKRSPSWRDSEPYPSTRDEGEEEEEKIEEGFDPPKGEGGDEVKEDSGGGGTGRRPFIFLVVRVPLRV